MMATLPFNDLRVQYISRIGAVYYLALLCCGGLPVLGLKSKNNISLFKSYIKNFI